MNVNPSSFFARIGGVARIVARPLVAAVVAACAALSPATAFAFLEIDRGELILNTTAQATYDSNVFARSDETSDLYFSLIPELQYLRQAGRGTIDARAGVDFTRFVDLSDQNFEDIYGLLDVTLPVSADSPLSGGVHLGYTEHSGVNEFLNERVRTERYRAETELRYRVSERLGLRNNLGYSYQRSKDFSNIEAVFGTFGVQHEYSENLALFGDYRLRRTTSSGRRRGGVENLDNAILLGGIGELRPRLEGTLSVGFQHTDARGPGGADANLIIAATELAWQMRPRTDLTLEISRDMDVSPNDFSAEVLSTTVGIDHRIEPKIELDSYLGFSRTEFRGGSNRRDTGYHFGAGGRYIFTRHWNAGIGYRFTNSDSNSTFADYQRHMVHISTRFSF